MNLFKVYVASVALFCGLIGVFFIVTAKGQVPFYSCTQAKAAGIVNIPKDSPYYRASLDRDKDGYACEN